MQQDIFIFSINNPGQRSDVEMMVKHFCTEVLSIPILKIYKYWSSLLVYLYDESVSYLSSSYLLFSIPMNKVNFQK